MIKPLLFLLMSTAPILAQIILNPNEMLKDLAKNQTDQTSLEAKAIQFLFKAHPELSNYTVVAINMTIDRGNQSYALNLIDFLFELDSLQNRIMAMVSLSVLEDQSFASISPLVRTDSEKDGENELGDYWVSKNVPYHYNASIMNQTISSDFIKSPNSTQKMNMSNGMGQASLGSYVQYTNMNDSLCEYAKDYVASLYPNIVNYDIDAVYYQIVAGINVKIHYVGVDQYSLITVIVCFDLQINPSLLSFQVDCVTPSIYCTPQAAWDIFNAQEAMLLSHPELFSYRIVSLFVLEPVTVDNVLVMVTFENSKMQLRSLLEVAIDMDKAAILSFFTYSYSQ